MAVEPIRLRYRATCSKCGSELPPGTRGIWDREARKATCIDCAEGRADATPEPILDRGEAGASAARRYAKLRERREHQARKKFGKLSGAYLALTSEPQSTRAWDVGAKGEQALGRFLEALHDGQSSFVLHDRRIPASKANIDHVAVTTAGVFVIDAKRYEGRVQRVDKGGWFSVDERLYVGGRDRTKLVMKMAKQVVAVQEALARAETEEFAVPVIPVLCFVDADWSLFARPFQLGGVWVEWPKSVRERITRGGSISLDRVALVAQRVSEALPPA